MIEEKQAAFMEAYAPCHEPFMRYCKALSYGQMNVEDLTQDILLSAYEHFDKIQNKQQLLHYLIRAARNKSISQWRKRKYKTEFIDTHSEHLRARGISPEIRMDIQLLYHYLNVLPDQQREALILFEISGFSMKEIAEIQNSNEGAVKNRVSRGRKKIRQYMQQKPKNRWMLWLMMVRPWSIPPSGTPGSETHLFEVIRQIPVPLQQTAVLQGLHQGTAAVPINFPLSWTQPIQLNHILMSTISLSSILLLGVIAFLPPKTTTSSVHQEDTQTTITSDTQVKARNAVNPLERAGFQFTPVSTESLSKLLFFQVSPQEIPVAPVLMTPTTQLEPETPSPRKSLKSFTIPYVNCTIPVKVEGNIKTFRQLLLQNLIKDGLISTRNENVRMTFLDNGIQVNSTPLNNALPEKYTSLITQYNVHPCPQRIIQITDAYIAIGDITDEGFKGRIQGRVDMDDLNAIKIEGTSSINGQGKIMKEDIEERPITPFHSIRVGGLAVVYLSRGETKNALVKVSGMPIEDLLTTVEDGVLIVTTRGEHHGESIRVNISAPTLKGIEVEGAGQLYTEDVIVAKDLGVIVEDSGAATLKVDTKTVNIMMQGGDLDISGKTGAQNIMQGGSDASKGSLNNHQLRIIK